MIKDDISEEFVEKVEDRVGCGSGGWDLIDPKIIIAEVINVFTDGEYEEVKIEVQK